MRRSILVSVVALAALLTLSAVAFGATPTPPFTTNSACLECHQVTQQAPINRVDFAVAGTVNYAKCLACHSGLPDQYVTVTGVLRSGSHFHQGTDCSNCHSPGDALAFLLPLGAPRVHGYMLNTANGFFAYTTSLSTPPAQLHALHAGNGWVQTELGATRPQCARCHATASCTACHDAPIVHGTHSSTTNAAPFVLQSTGAAVTLAPLSCVAAGCHALSAAGTPAFTPTCASCHPRNVNTHGYDAVKHGAADATTGGLTCSACHALDLATEHDRSTASSAGKLCVTCHPLPRNTFAIWDRTCVTGGCHTPASTAPFHAKTTAAHTIVPAGAECIACHAGGDLAGVHATFMAKDGSGRTACLLCHSATTVPATGDCTVCHFTWANHPYSAVKHTSSSTLANCGAVGCHRTRDLLAAHQEKRATFACADCHKSPRPEVQAAILAHKTGCSDCHASVSETAGHFGQHWASPLLVDASGPHYAYVTGSKSGTPTSDCTGCHTSNLVAEHLGEVDPTTGNVTRDPRHDAQGHPLVCATCHAALPGTPVGDAITNHQTNCDACHVVHKQISAAHTSTYAAAPQVPCSPCHSSQIDLVHDGSYTTTMPSGKKLSGCAVCHDNFESPRGPIVQAAITALDTKCTACHGVTHSDKGGHNASSAASLACGTCHAKGLTPIDVRKLHPSCATCHENPSRIANITGKTAECSSCHSAAGVDFHTALSAKHTYSAMPATCQSTNCHVKTLPEAHAKFIAGQTAYATTCALCHVNTDPTRIPANATAACSSCHANIHPSPNHTAANSSACTDCHKSTDALALHAGATGGPCDVCHANPSRVPVLPATTDCVGCHANLTPAGTKHYVAPSHTATNTGCASCHLLELQPEHVRATAGTLTCLGCHTSAKFTALAKPWDKSCDSCHAAKHVLQTPMHTSTQSACAGSGCHAIADLAALHSKATTTVAGVTLTGCGVCHQSPTKQATSADCKTCHAGHGDLTVKHTATASQACVDCHETGDIRVVHAKATKGACAVCHDNPGRIADIRTKTAECVSCHADHSPIATAHYPAASHLASDTGCNQCHSLDMKIEHAKTTSGPVSCVQCHETKVDAFTSAWNHTCAACHAVKHANQSAMHVSTTSGCSGAACHASTDVSVIHKNLAGGGCPACHTGPNVTPTSTACATCHPGVTGNHHALHDTAGMIDAGCKGCHFTFLDDEHSKLGYTCATCHSSTNAAVISAIATHDRTCDACHPAVNGKDRHAAQNATEFIRENASGHRVNSSLPGMRSTFVIKGATYTWSLPSATSMFKSGSGLAMDSMVTCDKCHTFSGAAAGPHGAAVTVNMDPAFAADYHTATIRSGSINPSNVICAKCHNGDSNEVHQKGDHDDTPCVGCHASVPHGWRLPRMLAYTTDPAPYASTRLNGISLTNHSANQWSESDCAAGCSDHSSSMSNPWPSTLALTGTLSGKVTDAAGTALAGVAVTTTDGRSATTDSAGAFSFGKVPTGAFSVTATKTGYVAQTKSATVNANLVTSVTFALALTPPPGTITGVVTQASGGAVISGATVAVSGGVGTTTDSSGKYTISGLSAGAYSVTVSATGFAPQTLSFSVISGGTTTKNVALVVAAPVNLVLGKSFTASHYSDSSHVASKAGDGNLTTWWETSASSYSANEWLRVDLGSSTNVSKVEVVWNSTNYAANWAVSTSTDGSSWTQVYSTTSGTSGVKTVTFAARQARYVRVNCTKRGGGSYFQIAELRVFAQ